MAYLASSSRPQVIKRIMKILKKSFLGAKDVVWEAALAQFSSWHRFKRVIKNLSMNIV